MALSIAESVNLVLGPPVVSEAAKVDYWRVTSGGHKLGFSGTPGKGTVVAGNPHVTGHAKGSDKSSPKPRVSAKAKFKKKNAKAATRQANKQRDSHDDIRRKLAKHGKKFTGNFKKDYEAASKIKESVCVLHRLLGGPVLG